MFELTFWGVRGSVATAGVENARVGGNTSSLEVRAGGVRIALDAGTGLRALGAEMMREGGEASLPIVLSHYHWDHIQGFPFFGPAYVAGSVIDVYGPSEGGGSGGAASVRAALEAQMSPPHFPVGISAMRAELRFHALRPGADILLAPDVELRAAPARHPDGCLSYRVEHAGRSIVYATDTEHEPSGELDRDLLELARGADVLVYDAQYTEAELAGKRGWGHSTAEAGARLADAAGVRQLMLFHHDPGHDDWAIARIEAGVRARRPEALAAREGMRLDVDAIGRGRRHVAA